MTRRPRTGLAAALVALAGAVATRAGPSLGSSANPGARPGPDPNAWIRAMADAADALRDYVMTLHKRSGSTARG